MFLKWVMLLPFSLAAICPLEHHQVCNVIKKEHDHSAQNKHRCTCAITPLSADNIILSDLSLNVDDDAIVECRNTDGEAVA
ncbi:hypothetical protein RB195_025348 [Necator americanus]|uniref:Phlebovirus glycoprotein G2 fusion domain-containing protein n=1 Tax=Necator americanus TaxID=51031 RepID=A0ABR1ERW8_NECAM